jgi:cyanate permease
LHSSTPGSNYKYVIEIIIIGVLLSVGIIWVAPGPLFTFIMKDYGIDRATVGLTTSIVSLVMAVSCVLSGILANRLGLKKTFAIGAFLLASSVLTPFASNIAELLVIRFLFAAGVALTFPVMSGIVMQWFSAKQIPVINGLNLSMTSAGNTVALFVTVLLAGIFNWQITLAFYGIFALAFALMWLIFGREKKLDVPASDIPSAPVSINIGSVLKQKNTLLIGLSVAGPFILFSAISSWLPTYFNQVFGIPLSAASSITGLFTLFGIPASILGGILPMRVGLRKPFLIIPGLLIGFASMGTFLFNNLPVIYISIAVFGVCSIIFQPAVITLVMELPGMTPQRASIVIAMSWALGNVAGFTGPLIVGFSADMIGSYVPGLLICSFLSWSLFIGGLLLPETGPRARRK